MSSTRSGNNKILLIKKLKLPKDNFEAYFPSISKSHLKPQISIREASIRKGKIISLSSLSTREESFKKSLSPITSRAGSIFTRDDSCKLTINPEIHRDSTKSSRSLKKKTQNYKRKEKLPLQCDSFPMKKKKSSFLILRGNDVQSMEKLISITKFYSDFHQRSKNLLSEFSKKLQCEKQ